MAFMYIIIRILFSVLVFSILAPLQAKANPDEALAFAKAITLSRIEYKKKLAAYFLKPSQTPEEEAEKLATFTELLDHPVVNRLDTRAIAEGLTRYQTRYQELLEGIFEKPFASPYSKNLTLILSGAPHLYPSTDTSFFPEQEVKRLQIEKMILEIWALIQEERSFRRDLQGASFSALEENGYSELPTLAQLLKVLQVEAHPWWKDCQSWYTYKKADPNATFLLSTPGYMSKAHSIEGKRKQLVGFKLENYSKGLTQAGKVLLEAHINNLNQPLHRVYADTMLYQQELSKELVVLTKNKNSATIPALRTLFEQRESPLRNFLVKDFIIRTYPLMIAYDQLLGQMLKDKETLEGIVKPKKLEKKKGNKPKSRRPFARAKDKSKKEKVSKKEPLSTRAKPSEQVAEIDTEVEIQEDDLAAGKLESGAGEYGSESVGSIMEELPASVLLGDTLSPDSPMGLERITEDASVGVGGRRLDRGSPIDFDRLDEGTSRSSAELGSQEDSTTEGSTEGTSLSEDDGYRALSIFTKHQFKEAKYLSSESIPEDIHELRLLLGGGKYRKRFEQLFDDNNNHLQFSFKQMKSLVERVGGKVTQNGTTHCLVVVPGGVSHAWSPHKKNRKLPLSGTCVRLFRQAFEMAGITPARVFGVGKQ